MSFIEDEVDSLFKVDFEYHLNQKKLLSIIILLHRHKILKTHMMQKAKDAVEGSEEMTQLAKKTCTYEVILNFDLSV